jgi:hypothetical protein
MAPIETALRGGADQINEGPIAGFRDTLSRPGRYRQSAYADGI